MQKHILKRTSRCLKWLTWNTEICIWQQLKVPFCSWQNKVKQKLSLYYSPDQRWSLLHYLFLWKTPHLTVQWPQLVPRLKCSSTVVLVLSNSHCWLREEGSHTFMKTRRSLGLLSIQLLLTGWYRLLSWRKESSEAFFIYKLEILSQGICLMWFWRRRLINIHWITFLQVNTKHDIPLIPHLFWKLLSILFHIILLVDCWFFVAFFHLGLEFSYVVSSNVQHHVEQLIINNQNLVKVEGQWTHSVWKIILIFIWGNFMYHFEFDKNLQGQSHEVKI